MAKHKKKRRPGGRDKQRPKTAERVEIRKNPMKRQLELLNAMRPCLERARAAREQHARGTGNENRGNEMS